MSAAPLKSKWRQLGEFAARTYVGALIGAPFAHYATMRAMWGKSYAQMIDWSLGTILFWSILLFVFAMLIGIPAALTVAANIRGFWKRCALLVFAGGFLALVVLALPFGPYAIFAPPAGAITAFACSLLNYDLLKQDQFEFFGKTRGMTIGDTRA